MTEPRTADDIRELARLNHSGTHSCAGVCLAEVVRAFEAEAAAGPRDPVALENDIRELRGAEPGELARRLVERGWTKAAAGPRDEGLREALTTKLAALMHQRDGHKRPLGYRGLDLCDYWAKQVVDEWFADLAHALADTGVER